MLDTRCAGAGMQRLTAHRAFVVIGAGGHAKVVLGVLRAHGADVRGLTDIDVARTGQQIGGCPILGNDAIFETIQPDTIYLANGLGAAPHANPDAALDTGIHIRRRVFERLTADNFHFPPLVHPAAVIPENAGIADGAQIMAGAVLQPGARVGENAIVNTLASVDHDCQVGAHTFIAPGAVLCGNVRVGPGTFIGAGAVVLPNIAIGENALIAAGAVVRRDVPAGHFVCR